jgi:hypothetical protein
MREDRRNVPRFPRRIRSPGVRVKLFDQNLIDSFIGGKNRDRRSLELIAILRWTHCHTFLLNDGHPC